jgi:hypothetical protein
LYHGWADPSPPPLATVDYYQEVVRTTFSGDMTRTRERTRLFMIPGMGHCRGGPAPDGVVDNERRICAYPEQAVYTGPPEGRNDPANWVEANFTCR